MPSTLRILGCSSSLEGGGSERQMVQLMRGLDRQRFTPSLYLLYPRGTLLESLPEDVAVHAYWRDQALPRWNWPGRIHRQQVAHLTQTLRQQHVDVSYDRLFHMTMINGPATRNAGIGRISTIVSPPEHDLPRSEKRWVWLKRWQLAHAYRTADRVIAVSQDTADSASRYYHIPRSQITVLPSPIDIHRIDELQQASLLEMPSQDRKIILSVGRLSEEKGHRYLIDALDHVLRTTDLSIDLHLIGDGPSQPALERQVQQLGIESRVHFHGYQSNPYAWMAKADLFCLPSEYEGLPNVVLEAMICRVPVITTDCTQSCDQILEPPARGIVVPKRDPLSLANAIIDRFRHPANWLDRLDAARRYVTDHHSLERWLATMQSLFEEVAESRPRKVARPS